MVPLHPCLEQGGKDSVSRVSGVLHSLTQHTPILCSLNQWYEQLDSVWTWGKRGLPWEGPTAKNGNVSPQNWGPGNTGPTPPLCPPIFVLLVCFFNLTSAAVCPPIPIFPPSPQQLFPSCPLGG